LNQNKQERFQGDYAIARFHGTFASDSIHLNRPWNLIIEFCQKMKMGMREGLA
jgi:hypothetical protein